LINETGEPVQLGPLDLRRSLVAGRDRKLHHLLYAATGYSKMRRSLTFAHAASTCEASLQI
jgi:hypothetical protein